MQRREWILLIESRCELAQNNALRQHVEGCRDFACDLCSASKPTQRKDVTRSVVAEVSGAGLAVGRTEQLQPLLAYARLEKNEAIDHK